MLLLLYSKTGELCRKSLNFGIEYCNSLTITQSNWTSPVLMKWI